MDANEARTVIWSAGGEDRGEDIYCCEDCEREALSGFNVLETRPTNAVERANGCAWCRNAINY